MSFPQCVILTLNPFGQGLLALYLPDRTVLQCLQMLALSARLFSCHFSQGDPEDEVDTDATCPLLGWRFWRVQLLSWSAHTSLNGQFCSLQVWERTPARFLQNIFWFVSSTGSKYPLKHRAQVNKPSCLVLFILYWHLHWPKEQKKITRHIWGFIKHCSRESFLSHYKHLLEVHLLI